MVNKTLKVLHLASFVGNVGDVVNHRGFRWWFARLLEPTDICWDDLEIREFYWGKRSWDEDLVALINTYDLCVIGGGNYLELWVQNSPTGTSIGFTISQLRQIDTPILFNALGFDVHQGIYEGNAGKAEQLLHYLVNDPARFITVRNDGANSNIKQLYDEELGKAIPVCPDGGFFITESEASGLGSGKQNESEPTVLINLASDMGDIRFKNFPDKTPDDYFTEFAEALAIFGERFPRVKFVFVNHIFGDLSPTFDVLKRLPDELRRKNVRVAAYDNAESLLCDMLSSYGNASLVLASRFHANVLALSLGRKVIPLVNYPQISNLYADLNLPHIPFDVGSRGFRDKLVQRMVSDMQREFPDYNSNDLKLGLHAQMESCGAQIRRWLHANGIINDS